METHALLKNRKHIPKVGENYGNFVVIDSIPIRRKSGFHYKIQCKCGNIFYKSISELIYNKKTGCKKCIILKKKDKHPKWKGYGEIPYTYFSQVKHGASVRSINFNIKIEDMDELIKKQEHKCAISNLSISCFDKKNASLDRIDSKRGYEKDNIQFVHKDINLMKNRLDQDYFSVLCALVTDKWNKETEE